MIPFTLELMARFYGCPPPRRRFFASGLNWIDILAVAPSWVDLFYAVSGAPGTDSVYRTRGSTDPHALPPSGPLVLLKIGRIFRVLKASRYVEWLKIFMKTLQQSSQAMIMVLFVATINIVIFGSVLWLVDRGVYNEEQLMYIEVHTHAVLPCQARLLLRVGRPR